MKKTLFLVLILSIFSAVFALNNLNMTCIGRTLFGNAYSVHIHGGNLYFTAGNAFVCADIIDSTKIQPLSWVNLRADARDFDFYGNYAFVTDSMYGYFVVDISDPSDMNIVNNITVPNCLMTDASVTDSILCLANGSQNNTLFYNVADPINPDSLSAYWTNGSADDIYAAGGLAFQTEWAWGLSVLDISDPANVTQLYYPNAVTTLRDVYASGIYTYLAAHTNGFYILSNEDTANMYAVKGSYNTAGYAAGLDIQGNDAYIADWGNGLVILDISDKSTPSLQGTFYAGRSIGDVSVSGNTAYTASAEGGIRRINVSDKSSPTSTAFEMTYGQVTDISILDTLVYMTAGYSGIGVTAIADTANPSVNLSSGLYSAYELYISGDTLYAASRFDGLQRFDISDRFNPVYIDRPYSGTSFYIAGQGDYIYISNPSGGIKVFNKISMTEISEYTLANQPYGLVLSGNYLYAACWGGGLDIINISNTDTLQRTGSTAEGTNIDLAIEGNYAYMADYYGHVYIVDITDKASPSTVNNIAIPGYPQAVAVRNDTLYCASYENGIFVYDVSDKMNPVLIGSHEVPAECSAVALKGDMVLAGCLSTGLWVFEMNDPAGITDTENTAPSINTMLSSGADIAELNSLISGGTYSVYTLTGRKVNSIQNTGLYFLQGRDGIINKITVIK